MSARAELFYTIIIYGSEVDAELHHDTSKVFLDSRTAVTTVAAVPTAIIIPCLLVDVRALHLVAKRESETNVPIHRVVHTDGRREIHPAAYRGIAHLDIKERCYVIVDEINPGIGEDWQESAIDEMIIKAKARADIEVWHNLVAVRSGQRQHTVCTTSAYRTAEIDEPAIATGVTSVANRAVRTLRKSEARRQDKEQ